MSELINYALVEETRPPIYTAMKYWGKKPHNIWREYINIFTPEGGVVLDPFCGSGLSAIESVKVGKKSICFDLNPISSFFIENYTQEFDIKKFKETVLNLISEVREDKAYKTLWEYDGIIHNCKYNDGKIYEVCTSEFKNGKYKNLNIRVQNDLDNKAIEYSKKIDLEKLGLSFIDEEFYDSDSFNANFIKNIGGNNFKFIWTERNLYVLSLIFSKILKIKDNILIKQLLFAFIMTTHLCCKMNIPRRNEANRHFSTSWGRSAYICSKRQMEQNPLIVFFNNCFGKQSVESSLKSSNSYINKSTLKMKKVSKSNKRKNDNSFDIKYGTVDILAIDEYIDEKSVDFIITDPPYGGLVQYLDLSYMWNIWLKKYNKVFGNIDIDSEITINKKFDITNYEIKFTSALKKLNTVLKDSGKMVITFHNQDIKIWNSFIRSLQNANFTIEKVIHQKNRRSGESVVANPYGTSGTDFYIRCSKRNIQNKLNRVEDNLSEEIVKIGIEAISERNEPTPYPILFDAILAKISSKGCFFSNDSDADIKKSLGKEIDKTFKILKNDKGNSLWWLKEPDKYIKYYQIPLSERVDRVILLELKNKARITLDDALAIVYKMFPNGLTPDADSVKKSLKKFANRSGGGWVYNQNLPNSIEATIHSKYIYNLTQIARKLHLKTYIGKREQTEKIIIKNKELKLRDFCDYKSFPFKDFNITSKYSQSRIEMIDVIFIDDKDIKFVIEVENSTNLISAFHRASVLNDDVSKIIVIPGDREQELLNLKDPLSIYSIKKSGWKYLIYSDLEKLSCLKNPKLELFLRDINGTKQWKI